MNVLAEYLPEEFDQYSTNPETPWRTFNDFQVEKPKASIVTMSQCRLALYDLKGIKTEEEFLALADLLPEEMRERGRLELKTRATVEKSNPLVVAFSQVNGWDLDELFEYASKQ
ncbi:hypothetical protein [Delftia phage PhiW-14]|uniref:Uncharacterized protein n=1 Tax=Delftia phage PhiW-14 TaxID=665032 RepID=C9DG29_BPW14|nr:hypothetical protein DP-phiW-14_gp058 [Delftia phage PhiW-14]ACV50080.1 hypothetical protein [Delftia phage PhiW-14]